MPYRHQKIRARLAGPLLHLVFMLGWLAGCSQEGLVIDDAWIAEAPPGVLAQAGYLTMENHGGQSRTLVGATATAFESIEIHRTVYEEAAGLAKMVHQKAVSIAPREQTKFEPGGYHLMLIKPKTALKDGDRVPLTLIFANGSRRRIEFEVRREQFSL